MARAFAALEGQRLEELHACRSAEVGGASVSGGQRWISPQQVLLRPGLNAEQQVEANALLIEVSIAVAGKVACALGDCEGPGDTCAGVLGGTDVGLLVTQPEVLCPVF